MKPIVIVALVSCGVSSSACVCTPLSSVCGGASNPCPTETEFVQKSLRMAEEDWLLHGFCYGLAVGSTGQGTWVSGRQDGSCSEEHFFDGSGGLVGVRSCCEGKCTEWGLGLRRKAGPVTRELCAEVRASLVLRGAVVRATGVERLYTGDKGETVPPGESNSWRLPPGSYGSELADGGRQAFEIYAGGGFPA